MDLRVTLLFLVLFLMSAGCSQDGQVGTADKIPDSRDREQTTASQQVPVTDDKEEGKIDDWSQVRHTLIIEKLNSEDQAEVNIPLPYGWGAIPTQHDGQYTIVNEDREQIGEWLLVGQSPDQPDGYLPNHIVTQEKRAFQTKLGEGYLYQLELDFPDHVRTEEHSSYHMVYVLIPIANRQQSYNLYVRVPFNEPMGKYVELVERMLRP
ncbi:MAG: hypothetical protein H0Z33_06575 [Bacillaceae bacterium]|nr:hypothetical protein [Bacillaceae bacterium]